MRKIKVLMAVLFLCTISVVTHAQTKGKVTDSKTGAPLEGVSVKVKGTNTGVSTGSDGSFELSAKPGTTLVISSTGFEAKEVKASSNLSISLAQDVRSLSEVVVTALGIKRSEKSLGYSAAKVKGEELTKARESNLVNALSGKVSGVRVNAQSGTLGGSARIIIRGATSLNGDNQPIFIVDGVPILNSTSAGGTGQRNNVDFGNKAGDINPDDIETLNVLKGSSATALYGARAKNGAIVITTKKGKKGSTTSVEVNSSVRFDNALKLPDFQNEYAQGTYGVYDLKFTNGWGPKISDVQDVTYPDFLGDQVTLKAYENNVKDFFNTGVSYNNSVSFAGGGDNSDYRLSLASLNQTGIIPGSKLDRYTISLNSGREFNKKLSSRFGISYFKTNGVGRSAQASNNLNIITSSIYGLPRTVDINKLKNNFENPVTGEQIYMSTDRNGNNPYWITKYNRNNNTVDRIQGNFNLTYTPAKWLTISNTLGADIFTEKRDFLVKKGTAGFQDGEFTTVDLFSRQLNNDFVVTADKKINDFSFKLIAGHNVFERETRGVSVLATALTVDQLYAYANAASKDPNNTYTKQRLVGVFGDFGVSYKDFAFLNVTGRNDWTSTLPKNKNSYFYPSVSGSFVFSEFLKDLSWLDYGKLRASWANVGGDADPYQLSFQYTPVTTVFIQYVSANATLFPFAPINTAYSGPRTLPALEFAPQNQKSTEFGVDLKFLKSRIGLSFTYYNNLTTEQLINIDVPTSTGYFAKFLNAGAVRNKGIELDLNIVPVKTRNFDWSIDVNFGRNRQVVEELVGDLKTYTLVTGYSGLAIKAPVGEGFSLYGTKWRRSPDGEFVIDKTTGLRLFDVDQKIGNIFPDYTMGITNSFNFKGITLSGLIDIRKGGVIYSGTTATLRASGLTEETLENREKIFIDNGVNYDAGTDKYTANATPVQSMQDFWSTSYAATSNTEGNVFDASFVKLREIRLSYALPKKFLGKSFVKGIEFGVEARNVAILKSYVPHVDPEQNFFGAGSVGEGVEFNSVPSTRSIGVNLRLNF